MDLDFILNIVISQIGEEKAKETLEAIKGISEKISDNDVYILQRLGDKGLCLITTSKKDCKIKLFKEPKIKEISNILNNIDI